MAQQASLFGPSAEELMYAQQLADQERQQQQYMATLGGVKGDVPGFATGYALGYGGGQSLGQAVRGLFGQDTQMADPRIAKAQQLESLMQGMSGTDLNDPTKLQDVASQLQKAGRFQEALYFSDRAAALTKAERDYEIDLATAQGKRVMKTSDLISFRKETKDSLKDYKETIDTVKRGFALYEQGKRESNTQAIKVLNREIANISKDSGIGVSEINNLVSGGSIPKRLADIWSNTLYGIPSNQNMQEKLQILQTLERFAVKAYNEEADKLKSIYKNRIDAEELNATLQPKSLSGYTRDEYLPSQQISTDDADINDFMKTLYGQGE